MTVGTNRVWAGNLIGLSCKGRPSDLPQSRLSDYQKFVDDNCKIETTTIPEPGTVIGLLSLSAVFGLQKVRDRKRG